MTARVDRPAIENTVSNIHERVRILEAIVPQGGGSGSTTICTGCYDIDPEFADCVELTGGKCVVIANHPVLSFNPTDPDVFVESANAVGPYLCNYQAGFRVQVRYVGPLKRAALWGSVAHDPSTPGATDW